MCVQAGSSLATQAGRRENLFASDAFLGSLEKKSRAAAEAPKPCPAMRCRF